MKNVKYRNPKHPIEKNARVACVSGIFVENEPRINFLRSLIEPNVYKEYVDDRLAGLKFTLACLEHYDAGIDYDLVLVNNDTPNKNAVRLIKDKADVYMERENEGYGFGAYKYAWETLGDKYDYYLFFEQDIAPTKDGWLSEILFKFLEDREIGAVGNVIEGRGSMGNALSETVFAELPNLKDRTFMNNFCGAFTFTSSKILKQIDDIGGLMVYPCEPNHRRDPVVNEVAFQQPILELGYSLTAYNDGEHIYGHGICLLDEPESWNDIPDTKLAPMIHIATRHFRPRMKRIFSWYEK